MHQCDASGGARDPGAARRRRQPQQAKIEAIDAHGPGGSYQIYFAALTHRHIAIEGPAGVGKTALAERLATRLDAALVVDESATRSTATPRAAARGPPSRRSSSALLTRHRQQVDAQAGRPVRAGHGQRLPVRQGQDLRVPDARRQRALHLPAAVRAAERRHRRRPTSSSTCRRRPTCCASGCATRSAATAAPRAAILHRLPELNEAFNHFFFHYTATPLLVVETSQLDLTWPDATLDDLLRQIDGMTRGTRYYVPRASGDGLRQLRLGDGPGRRPGSRCPAVACSPCRAA